MTLGEKIQKLRKDNCLSQEQLAESLNVSRQALSKWELGTSIPEVDKIILISNYFKVSTDYLLKDNCEKEVSSCQNTEKTNMHIPIIVSSAIVLAGLIIGWAMGNDGTKLEYLLFSRTAPGMIVQVIGIVCFEVFISKHNDNRNKVSRYLFYGINIWFLAIFPTIFIVGRFFTFAINSYSGYLPIKYMAVIYFIVSCVVSFLCFLFYRGAKKNYKHDNK